MFILPEKETFYIGDVVVTTGTMHQAVPVCRRYNNFPLNIKRMISFKKSEFEIVRVNLKIYSIDFWVNENAKETWYFETEEDRDREYEKLLQLYAGKTTLKKEEA